MKTQKWLIAGLSVALAGCLGWAIAACAPAEPNTPDEGDTPTHTHSYTQWAYDDTQHWHVCPDDNAVDPAGKSDHSFVNGACTCGKTLYTKTSDTVTFGEYPQTQVTDKNDSDKSLRNALSMAAGANPTSAAPGKWTSYGYYRAGVVEDSMWYIDLTQNGARYRGVYFDRWRSYDTQHGDTIDGTSYEYADSNQDNNGYTTNTVYWFKYEPIKWRILTEKNGEAFLMSGLILDAQQYFSDPLHVRTVGNDQFLPNDYKESDIRTWLNETFFDLAFDTAAQARIKTTAVDNSVTSMRYEVSDVACDNTNDKVFLLSYADIVNTDYGFNADPNVKDMRRQLKTSDYANVQGVFSSDAKGTQGNGWWWLRTPYDWQSYALDVYEDGRASRDEWYSYYDAVSATYNGVVPALWIRL